MWLIAPRTKAETVLYARVTHAMFLTALALAIAGGFAAVLVAAQIAPSIALPAFITLILGMLLVSLYFCLRFSATWLIVGYIGRAARMYGLLAALAFAVAACLLLRAIFLFPGTLDSVVRVIEYLSGLAFVVSLVIAYRRGIGL